MSSKCPIWDTETSFFETVGDSYHIVSDRAGGSYFITKSAVAMLGSSFKAWKKVALTEYIFLGNRGSEVPVVDSSIINRLKRPVRLSTKQKFDRFFAALCDDKPEFGKIFSDHEIFINGSGQYLASAISSPMAESGFVNELELLFAACRERGFVDFASRENRDGRLRITLAGWEYLEQLGTTLSLSDQIFVAMWFGTEEQSAIYMEAIKPAIEDAGYLSVRIDATEHNEKIDDQIISEIRKSKALVVDLTCGLAAPEGGWSDSKQVGAPRGGVFFEAGFARGLGLPVFWTVKKQIADVENVVHFDVRQYNQIRWGSNLADFRERLRLRIEATLGRGNAHQSY